MAFRWKLPNLELSRMVPGLALAKSYDRAWLRGDVVAGVLLVAMLVPQGMAYAELAGLPPVFGLYATMVPLLVYAVLGPSRILILGPDSALAPVVAAAIIPIAANDQAERIALAGLLAVMVGIYCLAGGIAGLGFVTDLVSRPVRIGYLAGLAAVVIISQIPSLLGYSVDGRHLIDTLIETVTGLDDVDPATSVVGGSALALILLLRQVDRRIPSALIVVILGTVANRWLDLSLDRVGSLPRGLPEFRVPTSGFDDFGRLALTALAIALIAFADTSVLSRAYASRTDTEVDQNQELRALGAANIVTGLFQGFPISSSSSRTPVAEAAGAQTQLTGLVSAVGLGLVLVFASNVLSDLPMAVLSAVVIAAVISLIDVVQFRRLWGVHRTDFGLAVASFAGVAAFGVLSGIGIAIGLSVLAFLWRSWHPYDAVLGRAPGVKGYHDITRYTEAVEVPGLLLFRFDAPLFFANAGVFRTRLLAAVHRAPAPVRRIVVAAEPVTNLDSTAADMLTELDRELSSRGIEFAFAEMKDPVKDTLHRFGLVEQISREHFYPTLGLAVRRFVAEFQVEWVDWEDEEDARQ